jgi:hypothetical protein
VLVGQRAWGAPEFSQFSAATQLLNGGRNALLKIQPSVEPGNHLRASQLCGLA